MHAFHQNKNVNILKRRVWVSGYDYNATAGSRVALSGIVLPGSAFCFDPRAATDKASLPSGMVIQDTATAGDLDYAYSVNVTKPATDILSRFAGVLCDERYPAGFDIGQFAADGGGWVELAYAGRAVDALINGNMATGGYDTLLATVNAQWYLGIKAPGTNGADLINVVAQPNELVNASSALHSVCLGPFGFATP